MVRHEYITFHSRKEVCAWLNKRLYSAIIGMTESDGVFTIFYTEYNEEAFIRDMEAISCDPGFAVEVHRNVRHVRTAPVCQNAIPEPAPLC